MKKQLTPREKVLMSVLAVLVVFCMYYFVFYVPTTERITALQEEALSMEDQILLLDAKVEKMNKMKKELEAIQSGEMGTVKELPAYDNSGNVMNSLNFILQGANQYNVSFSSVIEEDSTVRRNINLSYDCSDYASAKSILTQIYESDYRSLIKDVSMSDTGSGYHVAVEITYFEYK